MDKFYYKVTFKSSDDNTYGITPYAYFLVQLFQKRWWKNKQVGAATAEYRSSFSKEDIGKRIEDAKSRAWQYYERDIAEAEARKTKRERMQKLASEFTGVRKHHG